jgi:DNA (cytosine-5)-methyltransferase 1
VYELALFAGSGGGILAGHLLGWRTVCAVELDSYCASVLVARQNDRTLPPFPVWDDAKTFDGVPWRGRVDVVSGGFPCQDISAAGKGKGITGERSGLWREFARIIREVEPRFVFVENSPLLTRRGIDRVLGDLAALGFDAQWGVLGAVDVGAPHQRYRIWIVASNRALANASGVGCEARGRLGEVGESGLLQAAFGESSGIHGGEFQGPDHLADANGERGCSGEAGLEDAENAGESPRGERGLQWWDVEPGMGRVAHGVARRVDRLKALGNGQVPAVAACAWRILAGGFE